MNNKGVFMFFNFLKLIQLLILTFTFFVIFSACENKGSNSATTTDSTRATVVVPGEAVDPAPTEATATVPGESVNPQRLELQQRFQVKLWIQLGLQRQFQMNP